MAEALRTIEALAMMQVTGDWARSGVRVARRRSALLMREAGLIFAQVNWLKEMDQMAGRGIVVAEYAEESFQLLQIASCALGPLTLHQISPQSLPAVIDGDLEQLKAASSTQLLTKTPAP